MVTAASPNVAAPAGPLAVETQALSAGYGRSIVLSRVSLQVPVGALGALVGPPGSGKSSLLRCLLGRLAPRAGGVRVLGRAPAEARDEVGYVPQHDGIDWSFPLSVADAVMMGRVGRGGLLKRPNAADRAAVQQALEQVGLERQAGWSVGELDLARRRRLLIGRALARAPRLLLLDEVLSGLSLESELELLALLESLRGSGRTVLLATRDLPEMVRRVDWLGLIDGRLVAQGRPAEVATEANLRATFGAQAVWQRVPATAFALDGPGS